MNFGYEIKKHNKKNIIYIIPNKKEIKKNDVFIRNQE